MGSAADDDAHPASGAADIEVDKRTLAGEPWRHAGMRTAAFVGIIGVGGVVAGCLRPQILIYLAGASLLAVLAGVIVNHRIKVQRSGIIESGLALTSRIGAGLMVPALVIGLAVLIPKAAAAITNRDLDWTVGGLTARHPVTVKGQVYLAGEDRKIHVLDAGNGRELWTAPGGDFLVGADGSLYPHRDRDFGPVTGAYRRDGELMWTSGAVHGLDHPVVLAATSKTTVVRACGDTVNDSPKTCTIAGLDRSGDVRWKHTVHRPKSFQLEDFLRRDAVLGERSWVLPTTVALLENADGFAYAGRPVLIDPDSGRKTRLGSDTADDLYVVGDRVLLRHPGKKVCRWSAYREATRLWIRWDRDLCMHQYAGDGYGSPGWILRLSGNRAYLVIDNTPNLDAGEVRLATLNLRTGASRRLKPSEASASGGVSHHGMRAGDYQDENLAGSTVILSMRDQWLVATDPETGRRLWRRPATVTDIDDIHLSEGLLVAERADVPNPLFGPMPHLNSGLEWTTNRRLTLVNPRTGRTMASAIGSNSNFGPNYPHHDLGTPQHAVVTSSDGGVFRIGR